ncbi:MAG: hypothetical protein Q9218_001699 [Villophora microphyllina]
MANEQSGESRGLSFDIDEIPSHNDGQRLGRISLSGRAAIDTPHYFALSSRGCVPHLTQDIARDRTGIKGIYTALEDFIERSPNQEPAVYQAPVANCESRLRRFVALQDDSWLVLGPRRHPPVPARAANTNTSIAVQTALGFSTLESDDYVEAAQELRPDIVLGLADYEYPKIPGVKRLEKMGDRTLEWTEAMVTGLGNEAEGASNVSFFAPILPIEAGQQSYYLETLSAELADGIAGWTIYDPASIDAVPSGMRHLPKLALTDVQGPHDILDQISLGVDMFVLSLVGGATDKGLALTFSFPISESPESEGRLDLGIDLWAATYASDLLPLSEDCECYTCKNHHRAFVRHLLDAKEMLAWVLLQIHNHHTMDSFFAGIRRSMRQGNFEHNRDTFQQNFQKNLPSSIGQGPRLRGYQVKSGRSESRRNPPAYRSLNDREDRLAEAVSPSPTTEGEKFEDQGFADFFA